MNHFIWAVIITGLLVGSFWAGYYDQTTLLVGGE